MRRCHYWHVKHKTFFPWFKDEGEIVASFGQAQLVKFLDGQYILRSGSQDDRLAAKEWIWFRQRGSEFCVGSERSRRSRPCGRRRCGAKSFEPLGRK